MPTIERQVYDEQRTKLFFKEIIVTVLNERVPAMVQAHDALFRDLPEYAEDHSARNAACDALTTLADAWCGDLTNDEQAPTVPAGAIVWVFHIEHRHGEGISVHSTEAKALESVHNWVKQWWHRDGPGKDGHEIPLDRVCNQQPRPCQNTT